jgi:KaiC/GvpD/RAD55 family RecA-like ATPase
LLLQYLRDGGGIRRAITVLKTRATKNDAQVREFTITADGITLGDTIDSRPSSPV